jgi:hypothetical protein
MERNGYEANAIICILIVHMLVRTSRLRSVEKEKRAVSVLTSKQRMQTRS